MIGEGRTVLTPKESIYLETEKEEARLAREHEVTKLRLELETRKALKELEVKLLELRVAKAREETKLRRIPGLIVRLFAVPFLGLGFIITTLTRREADPQFWDLLR